MARRKKGDTALDAWVALLARLPWWVGVLLAIASYVGLSRLAASAPTAASDIGRLPSIATQGVLIGLTSVGQYLVPLVCLVGAAMSRLQRRRARQLYVDATQRLAGGYVVTSGDFTDAARDFAHGREIQLINGQALQRRLHTGLPPAVPPAPAPTASPPDHSPAATAQAPDPVAARAFAATEPMGLMPASAPTAQGSHTRCPLCGATMVLREARTGAQAGTAFWGCSQFARTRCRGTRAVEQDGL